MKKINYYGCTHEEYMSCRDLIKSSNYKLTSISSLFCALFFAILFITTYFFTPLSIFRITYSIFFFLMLSVSFLGFKKIISSTLLIYFFLTVLYSIAFAFSFRLVNARGTMFAIFVVVAPVIAIDRFYRMFTFNTLFCIIYIIFTCNIKASNIVILEVFTVICAIFMSAYAHFIIQVKVLRGYVSIQKLTAISTRDSLTGITIVRRLWMMLRFN